MGDIVIVAYRPRLGCEARLEALVRDHVPFLRELGFATDLPAVLMRGEGGVVVELFEWHTGAVAAAHGDARVAALWAAFEEVCEICPLAALPEARGMFATFQPL